MSSDLFVPIQHSPPLNIPIRPPSASGGSRPPSALGRPPSALGSKKQTSPEDDYIDWSSGPDSGSDSSPPNKTGANSSPSSDSDDEFTAKLLRSKKVTIVVESSLTKYWTLGFASPSKIHPIRQSSGIHSLATRLLDDAKEFLGKYQASLQDKYAAITNQLFRELKSNSNNTQSFKTFLGDLPKTQCHLHLGGAIGRMKLLEEAEKNDLVMDPEGSFHEKGKISGKTYSAHEVRTSPKLLKVFLDKTTMQGVPKRADSKLRETHFHKTFHAVEPILQAMPLADQLEAIVDEEMQQGVIYADLMIDRVPDSKLGKKMKLDKILRKIKNLMTPQLPEQESKEDACTHGNAEKQIQQQLEKMKNLVENFEGGVWLKKYIDDTVKELENASLEVSRRRKIGNESGPISLVDNRSPLRVGFVLEVMRDIPLHQYVVNKFAALKLHLTRPDLVVSVTIDGHESDELAHQQWPLQNLISNYLIKTLSGPKKKPNCNPHACEWSNSTFETSQRIKDCIDWGAVRIGHATGIATQHNRQELLQLLRDANINVEVCHMSNELLLGEKSPSSLLHHSEVGMVIGSDDPGVFNIGNTLIDECVKLSQILENFEDLVSVMRNGFGLLPGISIYDRKRSKHVIKEAFRGCQSTSWAPNEQFAKEYLSSPRAQREVYFEKVLAAFYYKVAQDIEKGKTELSKPNRSANEWRPLMTLVGKNGTGPT